MIDTGHEQLFVNDGFGALSFVLLRVQFHATSRLASDILPANICQLCCTIKAVTLCQFKSCLDGLGDDIFDNSKGSHDG